MRIRTRLWLGFLLILLPVIVLGITSGLSFRRLSQSSSAVSESLLRYKEAIAEYTRLTHLNDLANTLLRNFLKLGYVTEMAEVHPLQARVREDLDDLIEGLDLDHIPEELKTGSERLRQSVDVLVVEKTKEITTLEYLHEVQSSKISGVHDGLEKLEEKFAAQMRVSPKRVRAVRARVNRLLAQPFLSEVEARKLFVGLSIHEIERLWEQPPLSEKMRSQEVVKLRLLARDVLLKSKSEAETRRLLVQFLKPEPARAWGQNRTDRLNELFRVSTVAYAERVESLMVVAKNLNFMRSMINQGTRMVTELQDTITQSRSRSFTTITTQLIPDAKRVEDAIAPRIRALEATVAQRLEEAQVVSRRSAEELSGAFRYTCLLVGLCLLIGFVVTILVTRAVNVPVQALVGASQRISHGDFDTVVALHGQGEFQLLADTFNEMSRRVRDSVGSLEHKLSVNTAISKAITQTTQMLAHDVRKPFSMLKLGLDTLRLVENNPEEFRSLSQQLAGEVQRALRSVDNLITDIMEIGAETALQPADHSPYSLVEQALGEVFRYSENDDIAFRYEWNHAHLANVDNVRMLRALSNIVDNARQALGGKGEIWFKTSEGLENGQAYLELCIGNSVPLIPADELPRLFEIFFTRGKRGGTGLGLAIAHKVVTSHAGGRIWALSSESTGTEFWCRLPVSAEPEGHRPALPAHSRELSVSPHLSPLPSPEDGSEALRRKIIEKLRTRSSALIVLIVEDEVVYSDAITAQINSDKDIRDKVRVLRARNGSEALQLSEAHPLDLVLCDLDLGKESMNGFEVVRQFRASASRAHICIHSNRSLASDYRTASDAGADAFLPKPMSRAHLLRLLLAALERAEIERQNQVAARSTPQGRASASTLDEVPEFEVRDLSSIDRTKGDEPLPN